MSIKQIESFFFHPDNKSYSEDRGHPKDSYPSNYKVIEFKSDNNILHSWFILSDTLPAKGTIIHFHGRAANITAHWSYVDWIPNHGFNLFTFDYRGYGKSTGKPSFDGVYKDCLNAINYVIEIENTQNIILLGQSLGGAFCLSAANNSNLKNLKGIVVDSTFDSFVKVAIEILPFLPEKLVNKLISDKLSPVTEVNNLKGIPKLFIHGTKDCYVPLKRGEKLFECALEPKTMLKVQDGEHLDIFLNRKDYYMNQIKKFLNDCVRNSYSNLNDKN